MAADRRTATGWAARVAVAALLALSVIGVAAGSAQAAPKKPPPKSFYGIVPQTFLFPSDFDRMAQGNVGTLRVQINWAATDPGPPAGDYNFSDFEPILIGAARNGIKLLPFLYGTPAWAATGLDGQACGASCTAFAPESKAARDAWAGFVSAAVERYGPDGTFWKFHPELPETPITAWQIWNEQNSPVYSANVDPKAYAKLLKSSAKAIRAKDPNADVVLGGMAELAGVKKAVKASKYLRRLYKVKRVKKRFDGVAPHPYGARLKKVRGQIDLVRKVMKRAKDKKASLWITELGWSSTDGGHPLNRGPKGQATRLKQAYKYFKKNRRKLNVKTVDWFSWMDAPTVFCKWCAQSGLFSAGLVPKPSWAAFTKLTGGS